MDIYRPGEKGITWLTAIVLSGPSVSSSKSPLIYLLCKVFLSKNISLHPPSDLSAPGFTCLLKYQWLDSQSTNSTAVNSHISHIQTARQRSQESSPEVVTENLSSRTWQYMCIVSKRVFTKEGCKRKLESPSRLHPSQPSLFLVVTPGICVQHHSIHELICSKRKSTVQKLAGMSCVSR